MDRRIGAYDLLERIGQGATSDVYRALHGTLAREAAVKVLLPRLTASEPARRMFLRESRLIARLDHPNVVRVHEAGEQDGALYIAMELVHGHDLRRLLDERKRLPVDETLDVVRQVAAALDAAHAAGLVHRDVKPSNILLADDESGRVLLTDFGLTTARDSSTRVSGAGHLVGSIPYMPPEQLEGRPVTPRADVYALACVAYECLVGTPPFPRASDVEVLWAHVRDTPPRASSVDPVLRSLDRALLRGLAKSPDGRPPSAGAFADELSGARTAATWRCPLMPTRQRRVQAGVLAAAAAAVVAAVAVPPPWAAGPTRGASAGGSSASAGQLRPAVAPPGSPAPGEAAPVTGRAPLAVEGPRAVTGPAQTVPQLLAAELVPRQPASVPRGLDPTAVQARVESLRYDASLVADCAAGTPEQVGCVRLETRPDEHSIHVAILDQTRLPIRAWIRQDVDRDGDFDGDWTEICAQTDAPVSVQPRAIVDISLETGRCGSEGRSVPTSGLVSVSLFGQR